MFGNRPARRDPRTAACLKTRQDGIQRTDPCRTSQDAQMQPDRQHGRLILKQKAVVGCKTVARKVIGVDEPATWLKTHVIGIERVRQYDMPTLRIVHKRGKVVIIRI